MTENELIALMRSVFPKGELFMDNWQYVINTGLTLDDSGNVVPMGE